MRSHHEVLDVQVAADGSPVSFRWRGRRYRVHERITQWQARTAWWQHAPGAVALEETVWRVEAGTDGNRGVFDLKHGTAWTLIGVLD